LRANRVSQSALGFVAALWTIALFLAPGPLFPVGRFVCHQRPERSFFFNGHQLPVCARCTGLYVGAAIAAPVALAFAWSLAGARARLALGLAAIPTLLTWTLEYAGLYPFSNVARFAAAVPLGFTAAWLVLSEIRGVDPKRTSAAGRRTSDA